METIHIAVASDENYWSGLLVTTCSIGECASRDCELVFHVIDGGLLSDHKILIEKRLRELHPKVSVDWISFLKLPDYEGFAALPIYHGNCMSYARLALPYLLVDVNYCIYCDVDFLWLADVAELWREMRPSDLVLGVREACLDTLDEEEAWCFSENVPFRRNQYVCAGLSFYNLERLRRTRMAEHIIEFLRNHPGVPFADQTALNAVLGGEVRLIDEKWQRMTVALRGIAPRKDFVLHYAGNPPWRFDSGTSILTDAFLLWHEYRAKYTGTTRWRSLRSMASAWKLILGRLYWHVVRCPLLRVLFFALLRMMGHGKCCKRMLIRCEKVGVG